MKALYIILLLSTSVHAVEEEKYDLNVVKYEFKDKTRIIGWKAKDKPFYFGHLRGEGAAFVWKTEDNQVHLSKDGVTLTKRF